MTLNQLLSEVYSLGFEDSGELNGSFLFAANRARAIIYSELADEKCAALFLNAPALSYYSEKYCHPPGEKFTFHMTGYSLSFTYCGSGEYTITDSSGKRTTAFNKTYGQVKEFFDEECTLEFEGNLSFIIFDIAAYSEKYTEDRQKLPQYSRFREIKLCDCISDFGAVTRAPENKDGIALPKSSIVGGTLRVPYSYSGEIFVYYKPTHTSLLLSDAEKEIELPAMTEHLLPILTASYLWLDDDPEKAEYYASVYRTEANRLLVTQPKSMSVEYKDVLGWA